MAPLFECAENAHQHRLTIGAPLAAVAGAVLAEDDRRANRSLGVGGARNTLLIQEREQLVPTVPRTLNETVSEAPHKAATAAIGRVEISLAITDRHHPFAPHRVRSTSDGSSDT